MTDIIAYLEEHHTTFNALNFCKKFSIVNKTEAVSKFETSLNTIARRNLKSKGENKDLIKWARSYKKAAINSLFASPAIVQYFYDENRKLLVLKERIHHMKALASTYDSLDANINNLEREDDDEGESEHGNEVHEADAANPADATIQMDGTSPNDTTNHPSDATSPAYVNIQTDATNPDDTTNHPATIQTYVTMQANVINYQADATSPANVTTYPESTNPDNRDHTKAYIRQLKEEFQNTYHRMDDSKKMRLANGKCVEDELFYFGMQCSSEHQCHSFIIDPSDINWKKYQVFSEEELLEIEAYHAKPTPEMPVPLRDYLNQFNKSTTAELRKEVFKPMEFDQSYNPQTHHHYDWIRNTCYNLLMEYEAGTFSVHHHEEWYKSHVWFFNDTIFNHSKVEVALGEVSSSSSSCRKNRERQCNSVESARKKVGTKCDMIFKDAMAFTEYGAAETGRDFSGETGTKLVNEGFLKLPKTLKDMLDFLHLRYPHAPIDKLETVGYIHGGLFSQVLRVDRPSAYLTRVTRLQPTILSPNVSLFGAFILPALHTTYIVSQIVRSTQNICNDIPISSTSHQDSSWLLNQVKRKHQADIAPFPQTSSSDTTKRRK